MISQYSLLQPCYHLPIFVFDGHLVSFMLTSQTLLLQSCYAGFPVYMCVSLGHACNVRSGLDWCSCGYIVSFPGPGKQMFSSAFINNTRVSVATHSHQYQTSSSYLILQISCMQKVSYWSFNLLSFFCCAISSILLRLGFFIYKRRMMRITVSAKYPRMFEDYEAQMVWSVTGYDFCVNGNMMS